MSSFLSQLNWRFATKKFDTTKKVPEGDLKTIMEAIRMAPSSFGIQPYHVFVISNDELRAKMSDVSLKQAQVTESSHMFVFCSKTNLAERIDEYVEVASGGDEAAKAGLKGYSDMMHGALDSRTDEAKLNWAGRQTYIALGFGLAACAELGIDACPMEGFDSTALDALLELPPTMHSLAYMAIGYRAAEAESPKVRFPAEDLFTMK